VIKDSATVNLELMSRPECVTLVRSALSGLGERLEFEAELLDDLKTAISEACNNVVLHAYDGEPGPLRVTLVVTRDGVDVLVRDHGSGIRRVSSASDRMGVGLAVISALADRAQFDSGPDGGGTDVRMFFSRGGAGLDLPDGLLTNTPQDDPIPLEGDVVVSLAPVAILGSVFGRITRAIAAGSHFSVDRFSDLYPITDAIAAHAERAGTGGTITCSINSQSRRLELSVAPFVAGSGAEFEREAGATRGATPLGGLADEVEVEPLDGSELLQVVVIDHRS
jgi:anti-sigma regulatory factor (Ser/Thr protein kinase)